LRTHRLRPRKAKGKRKVVRTPVYSNSLLRYSWREKRESSNQRQGALGLTSNRRRCAHAFKISDLHRFSRRLPCWEFPPSLPRRAIKISSASRLSGQSKRVLHSNRLPSVASLVRPAATI
jgi:hypothetical protein